MPFVPARNGTWRTCDYMILRQCSVRLPRHRRSDPRARGIWPWVSSV